MADVEAIRVTIQDFRDWQAKHPPAPSGIHPGHSSHRYRKDHSMADFTRSGHVTLGHMYRDRITGFVGLATGRHQYLTGCVRFALEAKAEAGKVPEEAVFDEGRLEELGGHPGPAREDSEAPPAKGGPRTAPSRTVPTR